MAAVGVQDHGGPERVQRKATGRGESGEATEQGRGFEVAAGGVGATQQDSHAHVETSNDNIEQNIAVQGAEGVSVIRHSQAAAAQAPSKDNEDQGTSIGTVRVSVNQGPPGAQVGRETVEASGMKGVKGAQEVILSDQGTNQGDQSGGVRGTQANQRGPQAPERRAQGAQVTSQGTHDANASVQDGGPQKASKRVQLVAPQEEGPAAASRQGQVIVIGGQGAQGMELENQPHQLSQLSTVHKGHAVQGAFVGQVVVDPDNRQIPTATIQQSGTPHTRQPDQDGQISNSASFMLEEKVSQGPIGSGFHVDNQESNVLLQLPSVIRTSYIAAQEEDETTTSGSHTTMSSGGQPQQPAERYVMAGEAEQWSNIASVMRQPTSAQDSPRRHQTEEIVSEDANFAKYGRSNRPEVKVEAGGAPRVDDVGNQRDSVFQPRGTPRGVEVAEAVASSQATTTRDFSQGNRSDQTATSPQGPPPDTAPMTRGGELKHFLHGA